MKYIVKTPVVAPASKDPRQSQRRETTSWVTIGRAWSDDPTGKITLVLDVIPFRSEYIYLYPQDQEEKKDAP
jgi:hypothetical protein